MMIADSARNEQGLERSVPTLLLSTLTLPSAPTLAAAAREAGWHVYALDETPFPHLADQPVYYGGSDTALAVAQRFEIALLEPPLDLLVRLPRRFLQRTVEFRLFNDLHRLKSPAFVKPADALNKAFDAGTYAEASSIRTPRGVPSQTPILLSEPVERLAEFRCFVLEGRVIASSPYLSFGRPVWRPFGKGGERATESAKVLSFCNRLLATSGVLFPPAFVVDVGLIEERGWAVVEFNPAWCAGLLGADSKRVLGVLNRACQHRKKLSREDRRWVVDRKL
jgi:hypothetical protein